MYSAPLELTQLHKLNEHIELDALDSLKSICRQVLEPLLLPA
jgi:hypothetical protein